MSKAYKTRNKEARKSKKRAAKAAKKALYKSYADQGITKKTRRQAIKARKGKKLAKDFKNLNTAAVLARPNYRGVPGWVNRKAERLGLLTTKA